jgi:hypothetical protein
MGSSSQVGPFTAGGHELDGVVDACGWISSADMMYMPVSESTVEAEVGNTIRM